MPAEMNEKPLINLTRYGFVQGYGDITVYGTWAGTGTSRSPALVLVPTYRKLSHQRVTPCVIPMNIAWAWSEEIGDPRHCMETAIAFAMEGLGVAPDFRTCVRIMSIVRNHIGDLVNMKPEPTYDRTVAAEVIQTEIETGKQTYSEVMDHV